MSDLDDGPLASMGTEALRAHVSDFRRTLALLAEKSAPLRCSATRARLGELLAELGRREHRQDPVDEAHQLLETALNVLDEAHTPLTWAEIKQKNLEVKELLVEFGESWPDPDEDRGLYREMLEASTRGRVPLDWTLPHPVLGGALWSRDERAAWRERHRMSVTTVKSMLRDQRRKTSRLEQFMLRINCAGWMVALGRREGDAVQLAEAAGLYDEILSWHDLDWSPLTVEFNVHGALGSALRLLGDLQSDVAALEKAVALHTKALEGATRRGESVRCAAMWNELAEDHRSLGVRLSRVTSLEQAVSARRSALEVLTSEWVPMDCAMIQDQLGETLQALGAITSQIGPLEEAIRTYRSALVIWQRTCPMQAEQSHARIAECEGLIAARPAKGSR